MTTLAEKRALDARINNIFKPIIPQIPPKAVNYFTDGTSPESIGAGQQTNPLNLDSEGKIKFDEKEGSITIRDDSGNIIIYLGL